MALVMTLSFLALLSAFLIAFFINVQGDLQSSKTYANSITVKQLADTTTNLVMGQISDGTRGYEVPGQPGSAGNATSDGGKRLAWVSQPGLIRTYDDEGGAGRSFKLYSSDNMVTAPGAEFNATEALDKEVPSDWTGQPALFTDLNRPVMVSETDPRTGQIRLAPNFPILDPPPEGEVEGFSIHNAPGADSTNTAPMPVRWIYVLADGALTSPSGGNQVATFNGQTTAAQPTKDNPIVGRIAFWTDDETCKLNINTASEGVFWDRPWTNAESERALARTIPRQNEFNRYAGHPAATSLSPVFGRIFPVSSEPYTSELAYYLGQGVTGKPQGLGLAPRVNVGSDTDTSGAVKIKAERLYASIDELLYTPAVAGVERGRFSGGKLNREFLEQSKFFLTSNNRSPDLNLAGKPRISLWPIQANTSERNAKDKLIAFCSTTNAGTPRESPYYFQRWTKYSGDGATVYAPVTPSSQDPESDWTQVRRNQELFAYLQNQTATNIPGFGGNFLKKWEVDRDQILTQSVDFVRSSVNSYNTALEPKYDYLPSRTGFPHTGETQCIPLTVTSRGAAQLPEECMGFGRSITFTEAALVFFFATDSTPGDKLQAYLLLEPFTPSPGQPVWSPNVRIVIEGLEQFEVDGTNLQFPAKGRSLVTSRVGKSGSGHMTAFMGLQAMLRIFSSTGSDIGKLPPPATGAVDEVRHYPFVSKAIPLPTAGPHKFKGGDITIKVYTGYEAAANGTGVPTKLVQTIKMNFPDLLNLPMPTKAAPGGTDYTKLTSRLDVDVKNLVRSTDVVRSVEASSTSAAKGDLRMQAALKTVDQRYFTPHPDYFSGAQFAHSLRTSNGYVAFLTNTLNPPTRPVETKLVRNGGYKGEAEPAAARGVNGAYMKGGYAGDWDNGPGNIEDGAYINKADEGNLSTSEGEAAYFSRGSFGVESGSSFSPNRQIASAVSLGSLPTGVKRTRNAQLSDQPENGMPWQTLLFCRQPAAGDAHPGRAIAPRDHLYLDLFTMPIVEPYAISEPFSTAGKVNLNYQIVPFTYIKRSTALRGVLKSVKVLGIPTNSAADYKTGGGGPASRRELNLDETLRGFDLRFDAAVKDDWIGDKGAFRSASEICDMFLIPKSKVGEPLIRLENIQSWWNSNALTGDNVREAPYAQIYPRVTTRSNTFTVHMRVQSLQKSSSSASDVWDESRDKVLSEYRGSTTIERYVDAGDSTLPDFAVDTAATMDSFYRFRIISTRTFAP